MYTIQVFAVNSEGFSNPLELSEPVTLNKRVGPPSPPASLECIGVTLSSITLQWEAPLRDGGSSVTSYKLEICEINKSDIFEWKIVRECIDAIYTSYCVRNLVEGQKYLFRISASNDLGESAPRTIDKSVIPRKMVEAPSSPTGPLKILGIDSDSISIAWNISENDGGSPITNYIIEVRDVNKASWETFGIVNASTCNFQINDLIENNEYFIRVRAKNEARLTSNPLETSDFITVKSPYQKPYPPRDFKLLSVGKDNVTVEFNEPENNGGLEVFRYIIEKRDSNRVTWVKAIKVRASKEIKPYNVKVEDLIPGSSIYLRVIAENRKGRSEPCDLNAIINLEKHSEEPSKPLDLNIYHKNFTSAILQWKEPLYNGNDKLNEYIIEEWNSELKDWRVRARCDSSQRSYVLNNLSNELIYKYRVKASNNKGISEPSLETFEYETLKQLSEPSAPAGPLKAKISDDQTTITLSWSRSRSNGGSPIRRYIIEKLVNRNFMTNEWFRMGTTSPDETKFKLTEYFIEESSFTFRIIAENDIGKSMPLDLTYPITLERQRKTPDSPTNLRFRDKTATSINLVWKSYSSDRLSSADIYRIEYREINSNEWIRCGHSKLQKYTVYDLDTNSSYHFRVIAINAAGESRPTETLEPITMDITNEKSKLKMYLN